MLWSPYVIGRPLYFCPVVSIFYLSSSSSSSFFPRLSRRSEIGCLPYFYTWRGLSANLECRSETCCTRLAANTGPKKVATNRHLGTIAQLCPAISLQLRHVSTIGKKLVKQQYLPYMSHNMLNFGPLAAEILSLLLGHPRYFQRVSRLGSVIARHSSSGRQPNFAALNRGHHLYSAGRTYVGDPPRPAYVYQTLVLSCLAS